jgi:hypothetical protein
LASEARRQDLLVHLALVQVPGAPKYKTLPSSNQPDVKVFFRNRRGLGGGAPPAVRGGRPRRGARRRGSAPSKPGSAA